MADDDRVWKESYKLMMDYMPIIVFMTVTGVIGVVGNIVTFLFYRKSLHTSTNVLIIVLSVVDLTVCCLSFTTVADMAINVMFTSRYLCKLMYFADQWTIYTSVIILWIISVDRYLKICRPLWKQFTVRGAVIAIPISITIALTASVRNFVTYDVVSVPFSADGHLKDNMTNASFLGHYCTTTDDLDLRAIVWGFTILDVISVSGILVTFVFSYGSIVRTLFQHKKTMEEAGIKTSSNKQSHEYINDNSTQHTNSSDILRTQSSSGTLENVQAIHNAKRDTVKFSLPSEDESNITELSTNKPTITDIRNKLDSDTDKPRMRSRNKVRSITQSERSVTLLMLAVSVAFCVCFMPFFCVSVGIRIRNPGKLELEPLIQFAVRSPFWNSVVNPVLFCVFNPRYRLYVVDLVRCRG